MKIGLDFSQRRRGAKNITENFASLRLCEKNSNQFSQNHNGSLALMEPVSSQR